ncbi:MAG: NAD(P)-dependent oxidoreductase [Chloroflexota bacterium]|nr:NAD(P)-dependent oxidoreductase [Chloroflexota bacterium]
MNLQGKRVLVTGISGFIGSHLTERLLGEGAQLSAIGRKPVSKLWKLGAARYEIEYYEEQCWNRENLERILRSARPEIIYHLAATGVTGPRSDARQAVEFNVGTTLTLLQTLPKQEYERFIYASTCYEYGHALPPISEDAQLDPTNVYAASKAAASLFCQMYHRSQGRPITIVRPFTVYGPRQSERALVPQVILHALRGQDFEMTAGEQGRDWVYVSDVVEGIIRASIVDGAIGQTINLCTSEERTVREAVEKVLELMGHPVRAVVGARSYRAGEVWHLVGNNTRARALLGWQPQVELEQGLQRTIEWYTANFNAGVLD